MKQGLVQRVETKTSNKTGKEYKLVTIDGAKYGVWDVKLFPFLKEGERVSFDFDQSGDYKNLTAIVPDVSGTPAVQNNGGIDLKSESIARFTSLNNSTQMIAVLGKAGYFEGRDPKEILGIQQILFDTYMRCLLKGEPLVLLNPEKLAELIKEVFK